eukprot:tig00020780_g13762.t1
MRQHKDLDVLVVGGGMVGAALACSLERIPGMRVGIVDARTPHARMSLPEVPDVRVCAVTPTSERLLAELGAWDAIKAMRVAPYRHMQVWDEFGCVRYSTDDVGEPHLGHIIENNVISQALDARMEEVAGIQVIRSSQVAKLTLAENGLRVTAELDNGDHISSRLVIGADGRQSKVRTAAGLDSWQWKYGQKAVICTVNCVEPTSTAWQCFLPSGPLALLPMPEKYCNIVWSLPSEHADRVLALSDDATPLTAITMAASSSISFMEGSPPDRQCKHKTTGIPFGRIPCPKILLPSNCCHWRCCTHSAPACGTGKLPWSGHWE